MKKYPTLGCCGLDCGLCPRYNTKSLSKCPGCCGRDFEQKHPSCKITRCANKKNNYESCADCPSFPCETMKIWDSGDSFISHKVSLKNISDIKAAGYTVFIENQKKRTDILNRLLEKYDDGKSKSFYCVACALLPVEVLEQIINNLHIEPNENTALKIKASVTEAAEKLNISLKLSK